MKSRYQGCWVHIQVSGDDSPIKVKILRGFREMNLAYYTVENVDGFTYAILVDAILSVSERPKAKVLSFKPKLGLVK